MQVSTSSFYDLAGSRMSALQVKASKLQTQIATQKKFQTPSENVAGAQQLAELDRKDADAVVYGSNLKIGASLLAQADTTLGSISTQLQNALELTTQAANGTLGAANRAVIGDQINAIVDSLVSLANTNDMNGQPLFGTAAGTAAATRNADGTFTYNTVNKQSPIPIADGQTLQATETAGRIFTSSAGDTLKILSDLATALKSGSDVTDLAKSTLDKLNTAGDQVDTVRASVGARAARVDLQQTLQETATTDRADVRSSIQDIDFTQTITDLQQTMTVLSATQASFAKLSQLSIFNYLR